MNRSNLSATVLVAVLAWAATTCRVAADDWPNWRGPNRDAICRETGLQQAWPPEGPRLLWRATGLGQGYSGPAIVGTTLYIMGNLDGQEHVQQVRKDTKGDGKADVTETYDVEDGEAVLVKKEEDMNGDGKADVTSLYKNGRLHKREISDPSLLPL